MSTPDLLAVALADARQMAIVKIACSACLTFTLYDSVLTFGDEVRWIHTLPKLSSNRWLYIFSKYFAIITQIANFLATCHFHSKYPITDDTICRKWFLIRVLAAHFMLMSIESILMVRVYALYLHSRRIGLLLVVIFLCEASIMAGVVRTLYESLQFSHACLITDAPRSVTYFGSGGMLTQVIIMVLTFFQHTSAVRDRWRRAPIMSVMIRDGVIAFVVVSTILVVTVIYRVFRREVASTVFSGFISIASSAGCRLIINVQTATVTPDDVDTGFGLSSAMLELDAPEAGKPEDDPSSNHRLSDTTIGTAQ